MPLKMSFKVSDAAIPAVKNLKNSLSKENTAHLMSDISKNVAVKMKKKFLSKNNTATTAGIGAKQTGVALHYYGGIVKPVRAKNLAIPLRPEFKRKNPRELSYKNIFVFAPRKALGRRFLSYLDGGKLKIAYLLVPRAKINPHPEKFLRDEEIMRSVLDTVKTFNQKL